MSLHFHTIKIKEVKKETADCVSVLFEIPEGLKNDFQFIQGQSLTMRTPINGEEVRRTYSICSSPLDTEWRIAVKKQDGGLFSTFAKCPMNPPAKVSPAPVGSKTSSRGKAGAKNISLP